MKKLLFTVALITASFTTFAQVGIGTTNPCWFKYHPGYDLKFLLEEVNAMMIKN